MSCFQFFFDHDKEPQNSVESSTHVDGREILITHQPYTLMVPTTYFKPSGRVGFTRVLHMSHSDAAQSGSVFGGQRAEYDDEPLTVFSLYIPWN